MHRRLNKTSICCVLCIDIVGHSRKPDAEQIVQKEYLNALLEEALGSVPKNDRMILDTGDGVAIAFFGAPEDALTVALLIRDGIAEDQQHPIELRTGITVGPMRVMRAINGTFNVLGDGLSAAQQIMGFAAPDRIMVARSYYDMVAPENPDIMRLFSYFGIKTDRDDRDYEMYIVGETEPKTGPDWDALFAKARALPMPWLLVTLGVFFVAVLLLHAHQDAKAPPDVLSVAPDDAMQAERLAPAVHAPSGRQQKPHKGSTTGVAGRESVACGKGERMLNQCD